MYYVRHPLFYDTRNVTIFALSFITVNEACPTTSRFDRIPYRHLSCALTHSLGFFVVAPTLLGHGFRLGTDDFHSNTLAEVVGHSVGGALATILTSSFPTSRKILVILVNPSLKFAPEVIEEKKVEWANDVAHVRSVKSYMAKYPTWTREDVVSRMYGLQACASPDVVQQILGVSVNNLR